MYNLILKNSNEIIDRTHSTSLEQAKLFFMGRKQMDEKTFDTLYHVEESPK